MSGEGYPYISRPLYIDIYICKGISIGLLIYRDWLSLKTGTVYED